jgi:hypothetical protein
MGSLKKLLGLQEENCLHYKSLGSRPVRAVAAVMIVLVRDPTAMVRATTILPLLPLLLTRPHWPA